MPRESPYELEKPREGPLPKILLTPRWHPMQDMSDSNAKIARSVP